MQLKEKRIIVTGGGRGIGASVVMAYAAEGARVASFDVQDDFGEQVAAEANQKGAGVVTFFHCDISNRSEVDAKFADAVHKMGGLDVLINVAAINNIVKAEEITDDQVDRMFDINFKGTMYTNQAAFRYMRDHGGRIINYGSAAGTTMKTAGVCSAHYSASKGAVHAWTRCVANEWGQYGITANIVCPLILTPMVAEAIPPEAMKALEERVAIFLPLGRMGNADRDLAPLMVFLASDGAQYITGQTLNVDGGMVESR